MMPPANPTVAARTMTPKMSSLPRTAANPPEIPKANAPMMVIQVMATELLPAK